MVNEMNDLTTLKNFECSSGQNEATKNTKVSTLTPSLKMCNQKTAKGAFNHRYIHNRNENIRNE